MRLWPICRGRESSHRRALRQGWRRLGLACAAVILTGCPASPAGAATARDSNFQPNLEATVRYLQDAQREDGGFAEAGHEPTADFTAWVTLALAAAGINPRDQTTAKQHWVGGHSARTYLTEHAGEMSLTSDFERELLVVDAAGTSPHDFGGFDLVGEILKRQITAGSNAGAFWHKAGSEPGINDTVFAILALSPVHEPLVQKAIAGAAEWLESQQDCDGSWHGVQPREVRPCGSERRLLAGEESGEVDMTGAALQALSATGHTDHKAQENAFAYLREQQTEDGGFRELPSEREPNVASTAWAVQAMWSLGINPETWATHSGLASDEPLDFLASMQQPDGHIRWKMTAEVTPAFTGNALPIPEVPYEPLPALPPDESAGGNGGVSTSPGSGVIAGGGGNGAPLFGRPRPKSKGHTPGGVRQLSVARRRNPTSPKNPSKTRHLDPEAARKKLAPSITVKSRARPVSVAEGHGNGGGGTGEPVVKGVLIGNASDVSHRSALEPGAPGLRGAGAGGNGTRWLAIGTGVLLALLILAGSQLERRRAQVML
jgi:prenyltransferase beta subunit